MSYTSSGGCNSFLSDDHDSKMLDRVRERVEGRNLVGIVIIEFGNGTRGHEACRECREKKTSLQGML